MKNYLKSCSLLFIACLGILFSGCEKDLYEDAILPQKHAIGKVKYVTIEEVPFLIPSLQKFNPNYQFLSTQNRKDKGTGNPNRGISDLNLDLDHIIEYLETNGFKSYSVVILKEFADNEDFYFENLHIVKIGDKYQPFLFKYNADDDAKKFSLSDFTGKLEVSDVNKKYEGTVTYENGQARLIDPAPPTGEGGSGGGDDFDTDSGSGPDGHSWFWHLFHSGVWWGSGEGNSSTGNSGYVLIVTSPVIDPFNSPNDPLGTGSPGSGNGVVIAPNEPQWIYPTTIHMMRNRIIQRLSFNSNYPSEIELQNYIQNTVSDEIIDDLYFYMYEGGNTNEINGFAREMVIFYRESRWDLNIQQAIANGITSSAEIVYIIYGKLSVIATNHPSSIDYINTVIDGYRSIVTPLINTNPATSNWTDLFNMWLFELGTNPINFNGPTTTVNSLIMQEGVIQAKSTAITQIANNNLNQVVNQWVYGQAAFYNGMSNGNIATSFLGTYNTTVDIVELPNGQHKLTFHVTNSSTWESATRLRIDNDGDGAHDGVFPNHVRNDPNSLHFGGDFYQDWWWSETIN